MSGERRTNSSVGRESTRTTTRQCNYRYRDAKAASCMCLMHADGDKQRGCIAGRGDASGASSSFSTAEQFDLMQTFTESSSCRECTWIFAHVSLAASRLQLRGQDVFVLHTSNCGAAARAVGMNPKTSTQLRVAEWTSFRRPSSKTRTPSHLALGTTVANSSGKDVNSFTPWDTPSTGLAGLFCFQEPLDRSL